MLTALSTLLLSSAQARPAAAPPRLVVMIAVDQLVPEQLQRLDRRFTGGFRRLLDEGAVFWRATVDYACTETGPGHATFATGRWPSAHGIVGNLYHDRASGQVVYCVGDAEAGTVTSAGVESGQGVSPARLVGDALPDLLARRHPGSRTVTVAGKDRAAVLMGGRAPDAALWWHAGRGGFASSSAYGEKLPEFASVWNAQWRERARGWEWRCDAAGDLAALGTAPDERAGEASRPGRTLPRTLPADDAALPLAVLYSPLLDFFTLELALLASDALELGKDEAVDCLGISLSACDILGHSFGPDSVEVTDLLLRVDRDLGRLFGALDEGVGKGRWIACLSSDHGVLDLPEALQQGGVGARRVKPAEVAALRASVAEAVRAAHPELDGLELGFAELGFAFDEAPVRAAGVEPAELRALLAAAAEETRWVADAYTLEELEGADGDAWLTLYRRARHPGRGPDVALRPEPWLLFEFAEGTSHGSPYPYDRRVPLVFLGGRVAPQQRFDAASPTDAVPTLLALLGIDVPPGLDGRVLAVERAR
jgi:hypothetical protein